MEMQRAFEGREARVVGEETENGPASPSAARFCTSRASKEQALSEMVQQTGFLATPPSPACWLLREIPARRWGICVRGTKRDLNGA